MNNKEINAAMSEIQELSYYLDEEYMNNGGEITDYTQEMEDRIASLRDLLSTEGVDTLGRWMKAVEDEIDTLKTEKAYIAKRIENRGAFLDFIKTKMNAVMQACGIDKIKGEHGYSFTRQMSVKTSVDKDTMNAMYKERISELMSQAGIPAYISFDLKASATKAAEYDDVPDGLFLTTETPTVKFLKPRKRTNDAE